MSAKSKKGGGEKQPPRFPRLVRGKGAAGLEKLLWTTPHFEVRLKKIKKNFATQLIFTIQIPPDFQTTLPGLHWLICESLSGEWENAIADGYWKTQYNKRDLPQFIQKGLHQAFKGGVKRFLEENWNLPEAFYENQVVRELSDFDVNAMTETGPRPDARLAFWAANRYATLVPGIKALRSKFRGRIVQNRLQELRLEIERLCSYETYREAFGGFLGEGEITAWDICHQDIHPRAIALAIIECELPKNGYTLNLKQGSIWKHIQLGNELIELFAFPPNPPSPASA